MNRAEILYLVPYLGSLFLSAGVLFYAWQHRSARGVQAYTWYALGQTLWILGFIFELISMDLMNKMFWDGFQWLAGLFILIAFPVFAVQYTEYKLKHPNRLFWLSLVIPTIFAFLLMTDSLHHWIYPNPSLKAIAPFLELNYNYTLVSYAYGIYSFLVSFWGMAILVRRFFQVHDLYRAQIAVIILGFLILISGSILSLADIQFAPQRDGVPFTTALGNVIVAWGLIRFRIFEIIPIARDTVVDNMLDLVVVLDANRQVVDANPAALFALNRKPAQVIGQPAEQVFAQWPELQHLFNENEDITTESSIEAFGRTFHYEIKSTNLEDKLKRHIGRVFVSRDITERIELQMGLQRLNVELEERVRDRTDELHKSAERFRAVIENQTEFIVRWKSNGIRTFVNDAYCRYFGITQEQAIGTSFLPLIKAEDRAAVEMKIDRLISGVVEIETDIHRVIQPDGSIGWQEWTDRAIRDESGQVVECQSVGRDITERKQTENIIIEQMDFNKLLTGLLTRFAISPRHEIDSAIHATLREIAEFIGGDHAYLVTLEENRNAWSVIHEWHTPDIPTIKQSLQEVPIGSRRWAENQLLAGETIRINTLDDYPKEAEQEYQFRKKEGALSILIVPITGPEGIVTGGIGLDSHKRYIPWSDNDLARLKMVGDAIANLLERKHAEEMLLVAYDTTLEGWAKALELRDKETEDHSRRVIELTVTLAQATDIEGEKLTHIRRGAILHDIGKMAIPDEILRKRGPLTDFERKVVEQHPILGYELLSPITFLEKALDIPYCHHEHWDGSGYPRGLKGEEIPLAARLFSIVDVWDALLSDRPYSKAWPKQKAIEHIRAESGKYFDPKLVEIFLGLVEQGKI